MFFTSSNKHFNFRFGTFGTQISVNRYLQAGEKISLLDTRSYLVFSRSLSSIDELMWDAGSLFTEVQVLPLVFF